MHTHTHIPGFFRKKTAILSQSLRRNLHALFPPIQCCYIALLGSENTAISVRMPACIGQQHWSRGAGGSGVIWQQVGGWLCFFEEPGFFCLWMCNHKLGQTPFCTCQNPNPNTLSSSKLLATNKEATLYLRKVGPLSHRGCEVFKWNCVFQGKMR